MTLKAPSRGERHLSVERLESRQMMSGTALADVQHDTAYMANAVLRSEPVELLSGEKTFDGSAASIVSIPDSPAFTEGSFTVEAGVKVNAIRQQMILSKYESNRNDGSFDLQMLSDGTLQFDVYGTPFAQNYLTFRTNATPLTAGQTHNVRASFDIENRQLAIMVDGKDVPGTLIKTGGDISTLHDGESPVRLGAAVYGNGALSDIMGGSQQNVRFYPVSEFRTAQETQAADAAIAGEEAVLPLTEAEANALTTTQELTSGAVQTVLTAQDTAALRSEWNREQEELHVAEGRTSALLDGIAADRDTLGNLQKDLQDKRTVLAEKETSLRQCQDALKPLTAEVQRLTDLSAALTNEQQSLPGQIAALEQQAADGQKALQDTIAARDATERTLASIRQQAKQGEKDYSYQLKVYQQNWRNKALLNKVNALRAKIDDLLRQEQLLQTQSTNLSKKVVACQNALFSTTTELTIAKTRLAALPGELSGAIAARDAAEARLGILPEEKTRLASEIATLRETVSAQTAEADLLAQRIAGMKDNLSTAFLTEAHEWQDVSQMRRTVDASLLAVLEEDAASAGTSKLHVEATEDAQSLSLSERQLLQYRTRMATAQERLAEREKNLHTSQERVLALDEIVPGESDQSKKADLASLVPHARMTEDQALSDWQIARRETIAYAGITGIESEAEEMRGGEIRVDFRMHYRSPGQRSRMDVYRDGTLVHSSMMDHPAGETDGIFGYGPSNAVFRGDLEFRFFTDGGDGWWQVDSALASFNTRELPRNAAHVQTTFTDVESHDTGRLVDHPLPYALKIMSINGRNAVLHFTSPDDESVILSSTGGLYGQEVSSHPGGTTTGVALLTLAPNKPGPYVFFLNDRRGAVRDTVTVQWDGTTLTPVNQDDQWTSEAATTVRTASLAANNPDASPALRIATSLSEEAAETLEQERLELLLSQQMSLTNGIAISSMNRELAQIQAKDLYWNSSLFLSMEKMHEYFFTVHPDWRPENFQATVMRMWEEGGRNGPSGNTRDWLNGVILDQLGRYDHDLGVYDAAMGEILQKGIDACLKIRQGSPEGPLFQELEGLITARGYWEAVGRLKGIGVNLPDRHQVIDEARHIIETRIVDMIFRQSEDVRLTQNLTLRQQNAQWMSDHGGQANVSVLAVRKTVAGGYTQKEVSESEQRRLDRAARLVDAAITAMMDPRAQRNVVISNEPNIQRERVLANGTIQTTITTAEAEQIATKMDEAITESGGDATVVGEVMRREVIVIAGAISTDVPVSERMDIQERFVFGAQISEQLADIGNLGEALGSRFQTEISTSSTAGNRIDLSKESFSFIVSRPFNVPGLENFFSHSYIVVGAKYLGDTDAKVYSYGSAEDGKLGRVYDATYFEDRKAWESLKDSHGLGNAVQVQLIPANDTDVTRYAESFEEDKVYHLLAGNCNTAAEAIAKAAAGMTIPMPSNTDRLTPGAGNPDYVEFAQ